MPWLKQFFGTPHKTWPHCSVEGCCLWKAVSPHDPKFLRSALTIKCGCLSQNLATHLLGCWFFVIPKFIFQNPNFSFFHRGIWSACTSKADYAWWNIHEMVFKWQPAWFFRCCPKKTRARGEMFRTSHGSSPTNVANGGHVCCHQWCKRHHPSNPKAPKTCCPLQEPGGLCAYSRDKFLIRQTQIQSYCSFCHI